MQSERRFEGISIPPFDEDQIRNINEFQKSKIFHNFTCGDCGSELVASAHGLFCQECGKLVQFWIYEFVANGEWKNISHWDRK